MAAEQPSDPTSRSLVHTLKAWGDNSFNPMVLATFIAPQHLRPFSPIGLFFPVALATSSFFSLHGYKKDAAGMVAAQSALYILLAQRRRHRIRDKFSVRGGLRGLTLGLCALDVVAGGVAYVFGDRKKDEQLRRELNGE